ncbi:sugar ABC transporter substrate-binding protein [Pilimelia columellifera]|uniref:Sugar ABC transporter substrate-binding protein n=1 Tax=Pilimelia columellifera subsp. columellifera TaxID=706583 RepID=A0ABN3NSP3_9ACTN
MGLRRRIIAAVAAATLVATTAGCSGEDAADGRVSLLVFGSPDELAAYRTLASAYQKTAGGATVSLIEATDREDLITRLSTSLAGGEPPDLFLMNYRFYGQFAARDALTPLDERLAASTTLRAADLYPQATAAFQWRGRQLCLPQNVSSLVVYYNRDLFRRYAVPEPAADWTWNDFVATAIGLTRDVHGRTVKGAEPETAPAPVAVHGLGMDPELIRLAPLVWSFGGALVDDPRRPTRLTLDTPQARAALAEFVALRGTHGVTPLDEEAESHDLESRFVNGKLGMLMSSRRSTTTLRRSAGFDWDVAPFPVAGTPAGILHSDAYCMPRGAANPDGAWRFVEYALGPAGARVMAATGRTVPSLRSVAESPAFLDPGARPRRAKVFLDAIPTIRRTPAISTWPQIEDITADLLENAFYRGDDLTTVVAELDRQTRPLFARGEASS